MGIRTGCLRSKFGWVSPTACQLFFSLPPPDLETGRPSPTHHRRDRGGGHTHTRPPAGLRGAGAATPPARPTSQPGPAGAGPPPNFGARRGAGGAARPPEPARPPPPQHPGREVKQPGAGSCTLHSGRRAASIPAPPGSAKAHFFALICTFSTSRAPMTLPGLSPLSGLITLRSPPHPTANSRSPSLLPPSLLQGLLRSSPMESRERKRKREAEGREGSRSIPPSLPPPAHTPALFPPPQPFPRRFPPLFGN